MSKCKEASYTKKCHTPFSFAYKIVSSDDRFGKPTIIYGGKNAALLKQFSKNVNIVKK